MAGHSKFKNIMHRKGAQDKKRAKIFGRLIKELTVAARSSTDPDSNPRLRTALAAARAANMPKDNIERVLKRAEGGDFSMGLPSCCMPAFGHDFASLDDDGAHHWIWVCLSPSLLRKFKRTAHESLILSA